MGILGFFGRLDYRLCVLRTTMFNKRVKSKPANRSRQVSDEEEGGAVTASAALDTAPGDGSPSILATKLKQRVKKARPKSRLSFGGGDEEVCARISSLNSLLMMTGVGGGI